MKTDVGNIWSRLKSDPLYFSIILYHRSCSSFDFFGIVIVNVCFLPGADFLLNRALGICKIINYSFENSWQQNRTNLWMESMSGTGPFLSFPAGKSIFGKAIVAPPVVATALGTIRLHNLLKKNWAIKLLHPTCWRQPWCTSLVFHPVACCGRSPLPWNRLR